MSQPAYKDLRDREVDVCIIGSGPGGSAAALVLARSNRKVLVLEEGRKHTLADFKNSGLHALKYLYQNHGKRVTDGPVFVPYLLGKGLGGGTLVNSGISFRPPRRALDRWQELADLKSTGYSDLKKYMDEVESNLKVETIARERLGRNNTIFAEGLDKLHWSGSIIPRNTQGCAPCARCYFGCPTGAKQSTDKNFLPESEKYGAEVLSLARVEGLVESSNKIKSVEVSALDRDTGKVIGRFKVRAKHFILSAGAISTPKLLLSSNLANSSGQVGRNFRCHPATAVFGQFEESIEGWKSIMQGYYSDQFFESDEILIETVWAPSDAIATVMPGPTNEFIDRISQYDKYSMAGGMIRESGFGHLKLDSNGLVKIKYELTEGDLKSLAKIVYRTSEIFLAAGAKKSVIDTPHFKEINSINELRSFEKKYPFLGSTIILEGNHSQGTCRIRNNKKEGVVTEFGQSHDVKNLWIMDSSVFPDALGVNPQITIMSLAMRNAEYLDGTF